MIYSSLSRTRSYIQRGRIAMYDLTLVEFKDILSSDISTDLSISWDFIEEKREVRVGYLIQRVIRSF